MMSGFFVYMSPNCYHLSKYDREYQYAYIFVKQLSSLSSHPILLNFDANTARIRHLLHLTPHRFTRLLNSALRLNLCHYEGNNLRLISHTQERKLFKVKSARNYEAIRASDVKPYIQIQILKNNRDKQQLAVKYHLRPTAKLGAVNRGSKKLNFNITLSCRTAAKCLGFKSYSYTSSLLTKLSGFGLHLLPNKQKITQCTYDQCKASGQHNARYKDGEFYFLHANNVHFTPFYPKPIIKVKGIGWFENEHW